MNLRTVWRGAIALAPLLPCGVLAQASAAGWAPLSQLEIDDAHTCSAGGQLMVCAGGKKIFTGLSISPDLLGAVLAGYPGKLQEHHADPGASFQVDAEITLKQNPESGGPAWERKFYVINDEQLARLLERARREPEWKP